MYDPWDDHEATGLLDTEKHLSRREQARWPLYAAIYLFILLFTNFLTGSVFSRSCETCTAETNDDPTSPDRPLYKDLHRTSLHFVNFSAFSLTPSQYTAPASTEVDEAWRTLGVECKPPRFYLPPPPEPQLNGNRSPILDSSPSSTRLQHLDRARHRPCRSTRRSRPSRIRGRHGRFAPTTLPKSAPEEPVLQLRVLLLALPPQSSRWHRRVSGVQRSATALAGTYQPLRGCAKGADHVCGG